MKELSETIRSVESQLRAQDEALETALAASFANRNLAQHPISRGDADEFESIWATDLPKRMESAFNLLLIQSIRG